MTPGNRWEGFPSNSVREGIHAPAEVYTHQRADGTGARRNSRSSETWRRLDVAGVKPMPQIVRYFH